MTKKLISWKELLEQFSISKTRYRELTDPKSESYEPDFPLPVPSFGGRKLLFLQQDVDRYADLLMKRVEEARNLRAA